MYTNDNIFTWYKFSSVNRAYALSDLKVANAIKLAGLLGDRCEAYPLRRIHKCTQRENTQYHPSIRVCLVLVVFHGEPQVAGAAAAVEIWGNPTLILREYRWGDDCDDRKRATLPLSALKREFHSIDLQS